MKKLLPLLAIAGAAIGVVAALALTGNAKPGPDAVASGWADGMAAHDFAKVCSYEAPSYAGPNCAESYKAAVDEASAGSGVDVTAGFQHVGKCAVVDDLAYCFITGPNINGNVPVMVLEHGKNGSWHVVMVQ